MATYKEIKGVTVQTLDTDPILNVASWSSGGALPAARNSGIGDAGSQTAALAFGGLPSSATLHYNGTSWSAPGNDLNTARYALGSLGTQTASIGAGGDPGVKNNVEEYDGSSWSEIAEINTARAQNPGMAGTVTAGLIYDGGNPTATASVETWNGSAWSETTENNTARRNVASGGTSTSAILATGQVDPPAAVNNAVETWNGSAWTEVSEVNTARYNVMGGFTDSTSGIIFGGLNPSLTADTEQWNGSTWTEVNNLSTAVSDGGGCGASTAALCFGGKSPPVIANTEEFSLPPPTAALLTEGDIFLSGGTTLKGFGKEAGIPAATWASGTNFPSSTYGQSGFGIQTSAMICGGPTAGSNTMTYDGSSFTSAPAMNTVSPSAARYFAGTFGATGTSGLIAGGEPGQAFTETWNGSAWTEASDLNTGRNFQAGFGTSTSGIVACGYTSTARTNVVESWDGSSWTETTDTNTARRGSGGAGSTTSGIVFAGNKPPNTLSNNVETWDGSSWTETTEVNTAREFFGSYGSKTSNTSAMFAGGLEPGNSAKTEFWNGSSWTEVADLATQRRSQGAAGTSIAALLTTGEAPPGATNSTEEFTADNALSTVTVS